MQISFGHRGLRLYELCKKNKLATLNGYIILHGYKIKWAPIQLGSPFTNIFGRQIKWIYSMSRTCYKGLTQEKKCFKGPDVGFNLLSILKLTSVLKSSKRQYYCTFCFDCTFKLATHSQ